ncbi:hypothetical protein HDV01_001298 [Terramyces sp. JEL0728]|nr:hypothetical protein HDV01_001298 [Terramyces sp. JEL0728]
MRRAPLPHRHPKEVEPKECDSFIIPAIEDEPSDLKLICKTQMEDRAKQIRLSRVPILATERGRVRVARNMNSKDRPEFNGTVEQSPHSNKDHSRQMPVYSSPKRVTSSPELSTQSQILHKQPADSLPKSFNYFAQSKRPGNIDVQYDYKPPAAAKYFLWDSTRTGLTHILKTKDLVYKNVKTTAIALKNMRMELLKRHIIHSQSNQPLAKEAGFLLGKTVNDHELQLYVDRFDCGLGTPMNPDDSRPSCKMDSDVLIRVLNQEDMDGKSYEFLLEDTIRNIDDPPISNVYTPFPIYANVLFTPNEMDYYPKYFVAVPSFTLEIYPIHPIRIVNTDLSFKLVAGVKQTTFGYISIDQARQLFLLDCSDPLALKIPLVGIWCTNLPSITDQLLHSLLVKYIISAGIQKLDTGKNTMLICRFPDTSPSRPECYEVTYKPNDIPYEMYGTDYTSDSVEFKLLDEPGVKVALNKIFSLSLEVEQSEHYECDIEHYSHAIETDIESVATVNEDVGQFDNEQDNKLGISQETDIQAQPALVTRDTNQEQALQNVAEHHSRINPAEQTQQMYINLLQNQIASLQNQLISMGQATHSQAFQPQSAPPNKIVVDRNAQTELVESKDQSCLALPDTRSIGVNTDVTFNHRDFGVSSPTKEDLTASNGVGKSTVPSVLESELKQMNFPSIALPSDNGQNFVPLYQNENTQPCAVDNNQTSQDVEEDGKEIINNLVTNPEQSFIYTDADTETGSDNSVINLPKKSRNQRFYLPRNEAATHVEGYSLPVEISEADEKSFSFATLNYLSKYGLNNL